jgi:hypothetical protein
MKSTTSLLGIAILGSALGAACSSAPKPKPAPPPTAEAAPTAMPEATGAQTSAPTAEPPASGAASTQPTAPPAKVEWAAMSRDQKLELMKTAVMPKTTADFQAFDAKRYATVNCATCHGAGAKDGKFAMPNAGLPKLSTDGKFAAEMKKNAKVVTFMMEKVVPDTASALGVAAYDPATKKGFGCFSCHAPIK